MITRILSALVLIPLVIAAGFFAPPIVFSAAVTLICLIAFGEFLLLRNGRLDRSPGFWPTMAAASFCGFAVVHPLFTDHRVAGVVTFFLIAGGLAVWSSKRNEEIVSRLVWPSAGFLYLFVLFSFVVDIRFRIDPACGAGMLMAFLLIQWVGDTFAYFIGTWLGRHPLAPRISPKKTIEGAIGGVLGSAGVGLAAWWWLPPSQSLWPLLLLGGAVGAWGQVGDLLESQFKRAAGVKDSSQIIPGHGGVLDRLDSLIFTAPPFYYAVQWCIASGYVTLG
ncbi:MAG TPA: phosphatidate cytidylyltransferase [Acidobacteriota bacterium]|nr:phosphatidate cytidylyltransferase [Acidobacteriota bacterium]